MSTSGALGQDTHPKVFISYAWSEIRSEMVLDIGKRLLQDGIDVVLDLWNLKEGDDRFHFMETSICDKAITKVLIFSDQRYSEKADGRNGGVGIETQILTPELYSSVVDSKFIPVACEIDAHGNAYMPTYLKSRLYLDFRDETRLTENYVRLVRLIYGKPEHKKPPLGDAPKYIVDPDAVPRRSYTRFLSWKQAAFRNSAAVTSAQNDYLTELYREMPSYYLERGEGETHHDALIRTLKMLIPIRDELLDLFTAIVTEDPARSAGRIGNVLERMIKFRFRPNNVNVWEPWLAEAIGFFCWDLFLHTLARLIGQEHYSISATMLNRRWATPETHPDRPLFKASSFELFYFNSSILYRHNEQAQTRYLNYQSNVLKSLLSEQNGLAFEELVQADVILSARSYLKEKDSWFSHLRRYSSNRPIVPLFERAEERQGFRDLATVLGIESKAELQSAAAANKSSQWSQGTDVLNLMHIEKLDTK